MVVLVVVRLLQIAQAGQAELVELAYQGKDLLAVLGIEHPEFLPQVAVVAVQL
jgi:hypothetical protein